MQGSGSLLLTLIALALTSLRLDAQKGFISTRCDLPSGASNVDPETSIVWSSDEDLLTTPGRCISNPLKKSSTRIFPSGSKNCFSLSTTKGQEYLIRGSFEFNNFYSKFKPPVFNISIDATVIFKVSAGTSTSKSYEVILTARNPKLAYCLISIPYGGIPFISTLELRPIHNNIYTKGSTSSMLRKVIRIDSGNDHFSYRYPMDPLDRIWDVDRRTSYTDGLQRSHNSFGYSVPQAVLETAAAEIILEIVLQPEDSMSLDYRIHMHFVELNGDVVAGDRVFDIHANGFIHVKDFDILKHNNISRSETLVFQVAFSKTLNLTLVASVFSLLPPTLSAIEVYQIVPTTGGTSDEEVQALQAIKQSFGFSSWSGDPCLPLAEDGKPNSWDGVSCSLSSGTPKITGLNLSYRGLTGPVPSVIVQLANLEELQLQNNQLTGTVPEFLVLLSHLRVLHLQNNNLSGIVPDSLLQKSERCLLDLKYSANLMRTADNVTGNTSSPNKHKMVKILVGSIVAMSIAILLLVTSVIFCCWYKCQAKRAEHNLKEVYSTAPPKYVMSTILQPQQLELKAVPVRQFSFVELAVATKHFSHRIGEGGFGAVYHGILPEGEVVAVKVRSARSIQGIREFNAELTLLSEIQHENLVPLAGYCSEQQILVYPYMSNGSLQDRLHGDSAHRKPLDWTTRLNIALGAAQGLNFLHTAGVRCIIHRDVKSSNILLDNSMVAKVADFGFSKYAPEEDDSMVSLEVRGTTGYLDPEYYSTQQLTVKSDVYSFGVVLLEIICGREPLNTKRPRAEWSLVEWAKPVILESNVQAIVDPAISTSFCPEAMWRVLEIALSSVESRGVNRPTMAEIIRELEDALIIENNASLYMKSIDSVGSSVSDTRMMPPPMPLFCQFDGPPVFSQPMKASDVS